MSGRRSLSLLSMMAVLGLGLTASPANAEPAEPADPPDAQQAIDEFDKVLLEEDIGEPMTMDIASDGRVFLTAREGTVRVHDPDSGETTVAGEIDTHTDHFPDGNNEGGLLGVALDPDFDDNAWIYLYYAHPEESQFQLSRFDVDGNELDLDSEVTLLEVESQRQDCCHVAGDLEFDPDGDLYIATGDETNPFETDLYAPLDERPGREHFDAQGTAGDSSDLRGKILRITPEDDGSYSVPDGNLFPTADHDADVARPEIYVMGARNPFRMSIDEETGYLYYGMYGPGASEWDDERGPMGLDQFHEVRDASHMGWPFCIGDNYPFTPWDYDSDEPAGEPFDCAGGPVNTSPNNSGLEELPPVQPATIYYPIDWDNYPYDPPEPFTAMGSGAGGPNGGPVYRYDPDLDVDTKFPEHYDGLWFLLEWHRDSILTAEMHDSHVMSIDDFMPDEFWNHPHDAEFGPDGSLYVLEYGSGWFGPADDNGLYRIDYLGDGDPDPCPPTEQPPPGWDALFDGETTDGWAQAGPGGFEVDECGNLQAHGGMGLLWYEDATYEDFVLRADWRTQDLTDNSGVFLRFPDPGDDPWVPVDEGYEIQIYDAEEDPLYTTGSVYTFSPALEQASNPVGEWNTFEIEVSGQEYTVTLNGVEVANYTGDGSRGLEGHVGLQNHADEDADPGENVEFRNVWIQDLNDDPPPDADITVTVGPGGDWTYDPEDFEIYEGQTIEYVLDSGFHNVVTTDSEGNEVATSGPPSSDWQDDPYYFTAEETGTFYIYCTPHAGVTDPDPENWTGMVAKFEVLPDPGEDSDDQGDDDNANDSD